MKSVLGDAGMIAGRAGAGSHLSRGVQSVAQLRVLAAPSSRLAATSAQLQAWRAAAPYSSALHYGFLQQQGQQRSRTFSTQAAEDGEPNVNDIVYQMEARDPDYGNFVAMTGNIGHITSTSQLNGRPHMSFTLRVPRGHQQAPGAVPQYDTFKIEAWDHYAQAALASDRLHEDVLLQVLGSIQLLPNESGVIEPRVQAIEFGLIPPESPESVVTSQPYVEPTAASATAGAASRVGGGAAAVPGMPSSSSDAREQMWMDLFQKPNGWWDNREKKQGKQPDFKAKQGNAATGSTGIDALWVEDSRTPQWVKDNLQLLPGNKPYVPPPGGSRSAGSPVRAGGVRPDFVPDDSELYSEKEKCWADVFTNYRNWWDNRANKRNPNGPDFKIKDGDVALWITSKDTPPWVVNNINTLPAAPPPRS